MKTILELPDAHGRALQIILNRIPPDEMPWALTGSAGPRLQGVDLTVHDLDLQTDEQHIYAIEERLVEFVRTPVHTWETSHMHSLDGRAEIEGIEVEFLANITHLLPDGTWSSLTDFSRLRLLDWHGQSVPTFPLEDEAEAYQSMGRIEKAALIRETIRKARE
jgi:hypothetical protein